MAGTGMEDEESRAETGSAGGEMPSITHGQGGAKRPSTALERWIWSQGITARQLASDAKLSLRTIRDACRGRMTARTRTMIYSALDGDPEELLPDYLDEDF